MNGLLNEETQERLRTKRAIRRKMLRRRALIAFSVFAILLLLVVQVGPRIYAYYNFDRFYGFGVELEAEGERYSLYGEFHCRAATYEFSLAPEGNRPRLARGWKLLAKRLPSGAAIAIDVPNLCIQRDIENQDGTTVRVFSINLDGTRWSTLPDDYLPSVHWFDNADDPTVIEQYVERSYYDRADARVRVLRVWAAVLPNADPVDPKTELPFLETLLVDDGLGNRPYVLPDFNQDRLRWHGYTAVPIPEEIWSLGEELHSILNGLEYPVEFFTSDMRFLEAWRGLIGTVRGLTEARQPLSRQYVKLRQLPERGTVLLPDEKRTTVPSEELMAFRGDASNVSAVDSDYGVIAYYPVASIDEWPRGQIGGFRFGGWCKEYDPCYFFDPNTRTLYSVQRRSHALESLAWSWVNWNP